MDSRNPFLATAHANARDTSSETKLAESDSVAVTVCGLVRLHAPVPLPARRRVFALTQRHTDTWVEMGDERPCE